MSELPYYTDDFDHEGMAFTVEVYSDHDHGPPWIERDGHGPVREVCRRSEKRPGEVLLSNDRGECWAYDFAEAIKIAKRDGWGHRDCPPDATPGQRAEYAVRADMQYIREWLLGDRWWSCIKVYPEGDPDAGEWLGGVDHGYRPDDDDYLMGCARELAAGFVRDMREREAVEQREQREAAYWASRDVMTGY